MDVFETIKHIYKYTQSESHRVLLKMGKDIDDQNGTCLKDKVPWGIHFLRLFGKYGPKTRKARLNV